MSAQKGQPTVRVLSELRLVDRAEYGGKAAVLGEAYALGLPVLEGVAIAVGSYVSFLDPDATDAVRDYDHAFPESQESTQDLESARSGVLRGLRAADIATLASRTLDLLNAQGVDGPLLVRSSASVEDSTTASYAGQFESVRSDNTRDGLCRAIERVWESGFAPHVAAYGAANGRPLLSPAMGVVIQPYTTFEQSGVFFSRHPTTPVAGWALIEWVKGQPAELVSGAITPSRLRLNVVDGRCVFETADTWGDPTWLEMLRSSAVAIEQRLRAPVDVEWGAVADKIIILQARPITTL